MATIAQLTAHRDGLAARLDNGWTKIEEGLAAGQDVAHWEAAWLALLRQYEACHEWLAVLRAGEHAAPHREPGDLLAGTGRVVARQTAMPISQGVR